MLAVSLEGYVTLMKKGDSAAKGHLDMAEVEDGAGVSSSVVGRSVVKSSVVAVEERKRGNIRLGRWKHFLK